MGLAVGIDLGTTNSAVALYRRGNIKIVENLDSDTLTPSIVYITEDGEVIVGKNARNYAAKEPEQVVFSIKRFMGRDFNDPAIAGDIKRFPYKMVESENGEVDVIMRGRRFSPPEISAFILEYLKKSVEESTGQEVTHAVITVPAYFGNRQKEATRLAGRLANLQVMTILPEPTAAALTYGCGADMEKGQVVLVYDLGGGTFDVTVMDISAGCFDDLGKSGDMHLGGDDFDQKIMDWLIEQVRIQHGADLYKLKNPEVLYLLKKESEAAKIRLSKASRTPVALPGLARIEGRLVDVDCNLARDDFNRMVGPFIDNSIKLVYEAIRKANYTEGDIDHILLVGGSTRVPVVMDSLTRIFGDKVIRGELNPMHCVAEGAAYQTNLPLPAPAVDASNIITCDRCGARNLAGRPDCRSCGKSFTGVHKAVKTHAPEPVAEIRMIVCPTCQQETPQDKEVCVKCGNPLGVVLQRIPRPIGVELVDGRMQIILRDDMYYPTRTPEVKTLLTSEPGQKEARLPIYEGDDPVAVNNQYLGLVLGDLPDGMPENTKVEISLAIDNDGILDVKARIPDRPDFLMEARIEWKGKKEVPTTEDPRGKDGKNEPPQPDWKDPIEWNLMQARIVLDEGQLLITQDDQNELIELARKTQDALSANHKTVALSLNEKLETVLKQYGLFIEIGFARICTQNPDIAMKVGVGKIEKLKKGLERVDQYMRMHNLKQVFEVMRTDVSPALAEIMEILTSGDGGGIPGGNFKKGLLRTSSSGHY